MKVKNQLTLCLQNMDFWGFYFLFLVLMVVWEKANIPIQTLLYSETLVYPTPRSFSCYVYCFFRSIGPILLLLPSCYQRQNQTAIRILRLAFLLLTAAACLFSIAYTRTSLNPTLRTYSIVKNVPNPEISAVFDPKIRMEVYFIPESEETMWFYDQYLPRILSVYGDHFHVLSYDRTDPVIQRELFYRVTKSGLFDDEPIYLFVSYKKLSMYRRYIRTSDILQDFENFIQACLHPIERGKGESML